MKIRHLETLTATHYFHNGTLPCVVRVMKAAPSNETVALHGHEFSELVLVAAGSLKHLKPKKTEVLSTGDFFVIHPGRRHGYAELSRDAVVYNLIFTDSLRDMAHLFAGNPLLRRIFPESETDRQPEVLGRVGADLVERAVRLMDEVRTEEKSPSTFSRAACGALFAATVSLLARGLRSDHSVSEAERLLRAETDYLRQHLAEKVTLSRLRAVSGKSPSTLNRLFRAAFGQSPIDYLIARRLDQAEILAATAPGPLAVLAARCGFADASHLLRTFRRHGRGLPSRHAGI